MFKFDWTNKKADKAVIVACIIFVICYYDVINKPYLEKFNLKEQLPKPQNEAVVNDSDIADAIKHQRKVSADFNRMYDELNGWKKITWPSQPVDTACWFGKMYPCPPFKHVPTMRQYRQYIYNYEKDLYKDAKEKATTKYTNYKGKLK